MSTSCDQGLPRDEYTPHGYLANPYAVARSWSDGSGGCLRSSRDAVGFGWQLPWPLRAAASIDLVVRLEGDGRRYVHRADFAGAGLVSVEHSARVFTYRWQALGRHWAAAYTLVGQDALGLELSWQAGDRAGDVLARTDVRTSTGETTCTVALIGWRQGGSAIAERAGVDIGGGYGRCTLHAGPTGREVVPVPADQRDGSAAVGLHVAVGDNSGSVSVIARRVEAGAGSAPNASPASGAPVQRAVRAALAAARADDAAFWNGAARLAGDWPDSWRRGWVYDIETTRMCLYPAGGIFTDVWPSWMIQWPRAVVAEGTLDMARFGYACPDLAQRALLSLFRDAEAPNVPCVFQHGEPNMVAQDGAICGTSPAWCVPFYNLERLFAQTLDLDWLAAMFPLLARYVEWWLAERTDADGWAVYTCTWEAGEDDTPRLDPERRGDNVVSAFVRPVELQATMALSAGVLARFSAVLGLPDDAARWRTVEAAFRDRTAALWDGDAGRYRDWDARTGRFHEPSGTADYWGVDVCRYSALAFTPVLAGLVDDDHQEALRRELRAYDGPPWTLWASWSYVVLEAAVRLGERAFAGRVADGIVSRVYAELDARTIDSPSHPTPGVAREFWPLDLAGWASCEGYGWGANTASLLVRQIVGFMEGPYIGHDMEGPYIGYGGHGATTVPFTFALRPALPDHLLRPGREYLVAGLPYRGARLTVGYRVEEAGSVEVAGSAEAAGGEEAGSVDVAGDSVEEAGDSASPALALLVETETPTACRVLAADGRTLFMSDGLRLRHEVRGQNGEAYTVELRPSI